MKRNTSKIFAILMALIMVFTSAGVVFGGTSGGEYQKGKTTAIEVKKSIDGDVGKVKNKGKASPAGIAKPAATDIPFCKLYSLLDDAWDEVTYPSTNNAVLGRPGVYTKLPLVDKGSLSLEVYNITACPVIIGIYNSTGTPVKTLELDPNYNENESGEVIIPVTGDGQQYYAAIYTKAGYNPSGTQFVEACAYWYSPEEYRFVKVGHPNYVGHTTTPQTTTFQFKATKTGYVTVDVFTWPTNGFAWGYNGFSNSTATLYSSSGTTLSNAVLLQDGEYEWRFFTTFGVQKGKAYQVKIVQNASTAATSGVFGVRFDNYKASAAGGKTMGKAKSLAKNKTIKGNIVAGNKQAKWHKFKVSNNKVTLTVKGNTNKKLKYQVVFKKGSKKKSFGPYNISRSGWGGFASKDTIKGFKGWTCYVKVFRADKQSSGWYSLKRNK